MFKAPVPAKLPHLHTILDDLGLPDKQVAHFLDVTPKTVDRWRKAGQAPRPVMLALFWETRWGQSAAYTDAVNYGRMQYMQCLRASAPESGLAMIVPKGEGAHAL